MFYEKIRIKQGLSYISFCPLRSLFNSKFILMATSLGINAVIVKRVHCINVKKLKFAVLQFNFINKQRFKCTKLNYSRHHSNGFFFL